MQDSFIHSSTHSLAQLNWLLADLSRFWQLIAVSSMRSLFRIVVVVSIRLHVIFSILFLNSNSIPTWKVDKDTLLQWIGGEDEKRKKKQILLCFLENVTTVKNLFIKRLVYNVFFLFLFFSVRLFARYIFVNIIGHLIAF